MNIYHLPTIQDKRETVILANGEFPSHEIPLSILRQATQIVCCDGAVDQLICNGLVPFAIVGDCDSLNADTKTQYAHIIHTNADQETNDLTKAVKFCREKGQTSIRVLGATGKRDDHTLANISLLVEYADYMDVELITDYGVFVSVKNESTFESFIGQQVSIFSIEKSKITSHNLQYPIHEREFSNWWEGTLNESQSNLFKIETSAKTIVYRAF